MKVCGIIAEYNPFHQGHLYHMEETKKVTGCDYIIIVMSGDYTQRGIPALFNKHERAYQALLNGADLVLELPSLFSTSSAEGFAFGAVSLLHQMGVCDFLSFGSETGENNILKKLASFLNHETQEYQHDLKQLLKEGLSFPSAREKALSRYFPWDILSSLNGSNNILALEYCRALDYFQSKIEPVWIQRLGNRYNDTDLSEEGCFSSATSIRNYLQVLSLSNESWQNLKDNLPLKQALPESFFRCFLSQTGSFYPVYPADFSLLYQYCLFNHTPSSLLSFEGISPGLADRIYGKIYEYQDPESFCNLLKTKEITYSRISRSLLHVLLGITKEEAEYYKKNNYCPYAKILGFKKTASPLLREIKKRSSIPIITKMASASSILSGKDHLLFEKEVRSSHIYGGVKATKYGLPFVNEYQKTPVIL